jgi:O-antigen/teichoic acid export membrane protein
MSNAMPLQPQHPETAQSRPSFSAMAGRLLHRHAHVNLALLDQTLVSGVNFLTGILLARLLGLAGYGQFTLMWMIILFINSFQMAIILSPMMSIGSQEAPETESNYFGAVILHQLVFTLITTGLLAFFCWFSGMVQPSLQLNSFIWPLSAVSLTYQLQEFLRRYFFTRSKPMTAFINDLFSYLGQVFILFSLYHFNWLNTSTALWTIALTSAIAILVGYLELGELHYKRTVFFDVLNRQFHFSKWLAASTLMTWFTGNFLLITAGIILGTTAVGIVKACQNVIAITHILFQGLANIVPIQAGKLLKNQGLAALDRYLLKSTLLGGGLTFLLAFPAIFIPGLTLELLYKHGMGQYSWLLSWYAVVYLVMFFNQMLTFGLRALEETRPIFDGYFLSALISILISFPLVQNYGVKGIIAGLLLLSILNTVILALGFCYRRNNYQKTNAPDVILSQK